MAPKSVLSFHEGRAFEQIAGHYPTLMACILEGVQNAIDEGASRIQVTVDPDRRTYDILDNGNGTTRDRFDTAIAEVCNSQKRRGKYGQFGIGLVAPLDLCETFTFTSCAKGAPRDEYFEWRFNCAEIIATQKGISIPCRRIREFEFVPQGKQLQHVWWRSRLRVINYTTDAELSKLNVDYLCEEIHNRYYVRIAKRGINVTVVQVGSGNRKKIVKRVSTESLISGTKLKTVSIRKGLVTATFDLVIPDDPGLKKKKPPLMLGVEGDPYRFSFSDFTRIARGEGLVPSEVLDGMNKGLIAGNITATGVELAPHRNNFVRGTDAYLSFCEALEEWYHEHGAQHLNVEKRRRRAERYQRLGIRTMVNLQEAISTNTRLASIVDGIRLGTIGAGHSRPDPDRVIGKSERTSMTTRGGAGKKRPPYNRDSSVKRSKPEREYTGHKPGSVFGPDGNSRMVVEGNSVGVHFEYRTFETEFRLWFFNPESGVLSFNIRHPSWNECESSDWKLMRLQEHIALNALLIEEFREQSPIYEQQREIFDDSLNLFVLMLGWSVPGRRKTT